MGRSKNEEARQVVTLRLSPRAIRWWQERAAKRGAKLGTVLQQAIEEKAEPSVDSLQGVAYPEVQTNFKKGET